MLKPVYHTFMGGSGVNAGKWDCPKCKFKHFQTRALAQLHIYRKHGDK